MHTRLASPFEAGRKARRSENNYVATCSLSRVCPGWIGNPCRKSLKHVKQITAPVFFVLFYREGRSETDCPSDKINTVDEIHSLVLLRGITPWKHAQDDFNDKQSGESNWKTFSPALYNEGEHFVLVNYKPHPASWIHDDGEPYGQSAGKFCLQNGRTSLFHDINLILESSFNIQGAIVGSLIIFLRLKMTFEVMASPQPQK